MSVIYWEKKNETGVLVFLKCDRRRGHKKFQIKWQKFSWGVNFPEKNNIYFVIFLNAANKIYYRGGQQTVEKGS